MSAIVRHPSAAVDAPSGSGVGRSRRRLQRPVAAAGFALTSAAVATHIRSYRVAETDTATFFLRHALALPVTAFGHAPILVVAPGHHAAFALVVTTACSSATATAAVLAASAALCLLRATRTRQVGAAAFGGVAVLTAANLFRLVVIAVATREWGQQGFVWSHLYAGAAITIGAVTLAIGAYVALLLLPAPVGRRA